MKDKSDDPIFIVEKPETKYLDLTATNISIIGILLSENKF